MAEKEKPTAPEPGPQGGPAADPIVPPAPQPKMVSVKYGGKEIQLHEDAAQAWNERDREYSQNFSKQGEELGQLRAWRKSVESTIQPQRPQEPDINTLWFENPAKAQELIEQRIIQRVTSEYQRDQATTRFFDGFYRANDDLRGDEWLVNAVFSESFSDLADLPIAKAQEKLADLTRERILRLTRKTKNGSAPTPHPTTLVEPASGERTARRAEPEDDKGPKSLGDVIRARAMARREAKAKAAKGA